MKSLGRNPTEESDQRRRWDMYEKLVEAIVKMDEEEAMTAAKAL